LAISAALTGQETTITIDGKGSGRILDGIGGISSSSSRLLYDYPEPQRSQILDFLFRQNYGAALQILKVEIGSDSNSTVTSEPSHMRAADELNCHRGIEWWLMREARARNPEIKFYGLLWGAPGWLKGGLWSDDHVRYILSWLGCAKDNGFRIDYIGGANESYQPPPESSFFVALRKALRTTFPNVKIVATDEHTPPKYWSVATAMKSDPDYSRAVDILGEHDICHWRTPYKHCDVSQDALDSDKPLWNSEQSSQDAAAGAGPLARAMNRNYIDARVTGNINWPAIASFYGNTDTGGTGLMVAETPWSGYFEVTKSVWVDAHTTQFVKSGWRYIDSACGYLANGASYVTLRSPDTGDYTIVIETMDAVGPESVRFLPKGLSGGPVYLWSTDLLSENPADWFVDRGWQEHDAAGIGVLVERGHLYTLSTTTGQHKGSALPMRKDAGSIPMPLPYREDFEHIDATHLAPFFQDVAGSFEARPCDGGRTGFCYEQTITSRPILWHNGGKFPTTLMGDPEWWGDYRVNVDVLLEAAGYVELLGRLEYYNPDVLAGYHLQLADTGQWKLYSEDGAGKITPIASGRSASFSAKLWHRMGLGFEGKRTVASLDNRTLAAVTGDLHTTGQIGLTVGSWQRAQFDNVAVAKTRVWPHFVPPSRIMATATSTQPGVYQHHTHTADNAIDHRLETSWASQFDPPLPLPQAITLKLERPCTIYALIYHPPLDLYRKATITRYVVSVSSDGRVFKEIGRGSWNDDLSTKVAAWAHPIRARFMRLEATAVSGDAAGAGEIDVALSPIE
jgi:hypothetical protein